MCGKINKLFGGISMPWRRVILLSLGCGIVVGLLMLPSFLYETSFQQPGISYEFWILFALVIALNSKTPWEAGLKTFVGFVISQPLIYLVQVPFNPYHWALMGYYPTWIVPTVLTLPGGMLAWYVKRGNIWGVLLLSLTNFILCMELPVSGWQLYLNFPKMLLNFLFIIWELVYIPLVLFQGKKERILVFLLIGIMLIFGCVQTWNTYFCPTNTHTVQALGEPPFTIESAPEEFHVTARDGFIDVVYSRQAVDDAGMDEIIYSDGKGDTYTIELTYGNGQCETEIKKRSAP